VSIDASTIRHEAVHSTWLEAERGISIYLPPGYDPQAPARYPVLFLHDGQNLFDPARAHVAGQHWQIGETADRLILAGQVEPLVIVGIDHGGDARVAEFTPTRGRGRTGGRARDYGRFVLNEVMPRIFREFAVRQDAASIGLGGSSLAGLVTLVMALDAPGRFGRLMVMSPSVWWDRAVILKKLVDSRASEGSFAESSLWLDVGLGEGVSTVRNARRLRDVLRAGTVLHTGGAGGWLRYVEDADGDHSERSWARRFEQALSFLYPAARRETA